MLDHKIIGFSQLRKHDTSREYIASYFKDSDYSEREISDRDMRYILAINVQISIRRRIPIFFDGKSFFSNDRVTFEELRTFFDDLSEIIVLIDMDTIDGK